MRRRRVDAFTRVPDGIAVALPSESRAELTAAAAILLDLVEAPADPLFPPAAAPEAHTDPALARLFPAAYADEAAADEFRRLSEGDLRAAKRRDAERLRGTASESLIGVEDAESWLRAINDVRLVLAVRLGIEDDGDTEFLLENVLPDPATEPATVALIGTFVRMGILSELLIEALDD